MKYTIIFITLMLLLGYSYYHITQIETYSRTIEVHEDITTFLR